MILRKYNYSLRVASVVLLLSIFPPASTLASVDSVDYKNIGIWYNEATPTSIQLIDGQESVTEDIVDGANKLRVCVKSQSVATNYFSGLFSPGEGIPALAEVLATAKVDGFDALALKSLKDCRLNREKDYNGEQKAAILLFKAIDRYLSYCIGTLHVEDKKGSIDTARKLAGIMSQNALFGPKLVSALNFIKGSVKKTKSIETLLPKLVDVKTGTLATRGALQVILNTLKDMIRDAAAHSEMIALFDVFHSPYKPLRLVTALDMCYQCEKACVAVCPLIPTTDTLISITYKILVGSYKLYSNDGISPKNTRVRLEGLCNDLVKIALKKDEPHPVSDVRLGKK